MMVEVIISESRYKDLLRKEEILTKKGYMCAYIANPPPQFCQPFMIIYNADEITAVAIRDRDHWIEFHKEAREEIKNLKSQLRESKKSFFDKIFK